MEARVYGDVLMVAEVAASQGRHVVAVRAIAAGEEIARIVGHHEMATADRYSVQVGPHAHINQLGPLTYLNHSCAPNVRFNTSELTLVAIRDIAAGEELGFFYPSTEWQMAEPFDCHCGAPLCVGRIAGAAELPDEILSRYFINAHIHELRREARAPVAG